MVIPVPAGHNNISIKFSEQTILPIIFPPEKSVSMEIKKAVYSELLQRLKERAGDKKVNLKKGTSLQLLMDVKVHAECSLLAYHIQHPDTKPYNYFGGSKLSCHGCATFFHSFNLVAESFHHPPFFTKGCHHKIYLRWSCPFLLSQEQLRGKEPNLDTRVQEGMVATLSIELAKYVNELLVSAALSTPTPSDSTDASESGNSSQSGMLELERIRVLLGLPTLKLSTTELTNPSPALEPHNLNNSSGKFRCLLCPVNKARLFTVIKGVEDHLRAK